MNNYTNPKLRETLKKQILAGNKGGKPGQWSARKAQLLAKAYVDAGGKYKKGPRTRAQKSLIKWTKEQWGTKSGKPSVMGKKATGERYLPKKAREALSSAEYRATSLKKKKDLAKGKQFSRQPKTIARKVKKYRS